MSIDPHPMGEPEELASLYVAGAMTVEEMSKFESHLASNCPLCHNELAQLDGVVNNMMADIDPVNVDTRVAEALMEQIHEGSCANLNSGQSKNNTQATDSDLNKTSQPSQVWQNWSPNDDDEYTVIRQAAESGWQHTGIDGIEVRSLSVDQQRNQTTMLVRMAAGSSYPSHVHKGPPEECFVLEGDLHVANDVLRAGDYQRMSPGSRHGIQRTDDGCLLLVISSMSDEII